VFWLFIIIATLLEVCGDILFKKNLVGYGVASHIIGIFFWIVSIRYESLSRSIVIFMVMNVVLILLLSKFILNEHISINQWIGVSLCLAGIILI